STAVHRYPSIRLVGRHDVVRDAIRRLFEHEQAPGQGASLLAEASLVQLGTEVVLVVNELFAERLQESRESEVRIRWIARLYDIESFLQQRFHSEGRGPQPAVCEFEGVTEKSRCLPGRAVPSQPDS